MTVLTRRRTTSVTETEAVGARLGAVLRAGDLLILDGDLGAGKTALVRGLARGLGCEDGLVRSPTFVFHHVYPAAALTLHHIDCYRLGPGADLTFLDLDDLLADGAVVVEWGGYADLREWKPSRIAFDIGDGDERVLSFEGGDSRLAAAFGAGG